MGSVESQISSGQTRATRASLRLPDGMRVACASILRPLFFPTSGAWIKADAAHEAFNSPTYMYSIPGTRQIDRKKNEDLAVSFVVSSARTFFSSLSSLILFAHCSSAWKSGWLHDGLLFLRHQIQQRIPQMSIVFQRSEYDFTAHGAF